MRKERSGVTLVEMVIAMGALITLLTASSLYLRTSLGSARRRVEQRVAHEAAFSRIEMLRAGVSQDTDVLRPSLSQLDQATCTISMAGHERVPGIQKVTVTVRWKGRNAMCHVRHTALIPGGEAVP